MNEKIDLEKLLKISVAHPIIIYDGFCHLCNKSIQWIVKNDYQEIFKYLPQQYVSSIDPNSIILISNRQLYYKSEAVLKITKLMGGWYKFLSIFISIFPKGFRDFIYEKIASNRYRLWGRSESCIIQDKNYYSWLNDDK